MIYKKWVLKLSLSIVFLNLFPSLYLHKNYTTNNALRAIASETTNNQNSAVLYDENMQQGYEATNNHQYEEALNYFQTALSYRPDDVYAQRAINNVERMLANSNNTWSMDNLVFILLLSLIILVMIISLTLIIVGVKYSIITRKIPK